MFHVLSVRSHFVEFPKNLGKMSYYHCHLQVRKSKSERLSGLMRSTWPAHSRSRMRVCRAAHSWLTLYPSKSLWLKSCHPLLQNRNTSHSYSRKFCATSSRWGRCNDWFNSPIPTSLRVPEVQGLFLPSSEWAVSHVLQPSVVSSVHKWPKF